MSKLFEICLIVFITPTLLLGCKKNTNEVAAFTLESGIDTEFGICSDEQESSVFVKEQGTSQVVDLVWEFPCGAEIEKPYLTVTRNGGATLVFNSSYGRSSCSCARRIVVKINKRLEKGDTLYLVVNKEVVGHKLIVASEVTTPHEYNLPH